MVDDTLGYGRFDQRWLVPERDSRSATAAADGDGEQGASQADPATGSPVVFDVKFSAAVTGLTGSDFVVSGTAGGTKTVSVSGSGATYTASVTGITTGGTVVLSLPAGAATGRRRGQ